MQSRYTSDSCVLLTIFIFNLKMNGNKFCEVLFVNFAKSFVCVCFQVIGRWRNCCLVCTILRSRSFIHSEIIHKWRAHLEMIRLNADLYMVLRHLKIALIGKWRLTNIHQLWVGQFDMSGERVTLIAKKKKRQVTLCQTSIAFIFIDNRLFFRDRS